MEFPRITHNPEFHIGGVAANPKTNLINVVVDAAAAFATGGKDVSGTNYLLLLDPVSKQEIYRLNLTETSKGAYGGFQDLEFDARGNVYVVGSFPASILRVETVGGDSNVTVTEWFKSPAASSKNGMAGLAVHGDILLGNDSGGLTSSSLVKFDTRQAKGVPVAVPISNNRTISNTDAIQLPPRYNGTVLLAASPGSGVEVLRSKDGKWDQADGLGLISNRVPEANGGFVTATVQIGQRVFMVEEFFGDGASGGNRTVFPFVDITDGLDKLVNA